MYMASGMSYFIDKYILEGLDNAQTDETKKRLLKWFYIS